MLILPPTYLKGFLEDISTKKITLTGKLVSSQGNRLFHLFYYGDLYKNKHPIIATNIAPQLVIAKDIITQEEILLFDGGKHGYNALFCDQYDTNLLDKRKAVKQFTIGNMETFQLSFTIHYNIDYEDPSEGFLEELDENGNILLLNGQKTPFSTVKRNGFDVLGINAIDERGKTYDVISEELA